MLLYRGCKYSFATQGDKTGKKSGIFLVDIQHRQCKLCADLSSSSDGTEILLGKKEITREGQEEKWNWGTWELELISFPLYSLRSDGGLERQKRVNFHFQMVK